MTAEAHRRKIFAGISMIAAPLCVGIALLIGPGLHDDTAAQLNAIADAPGRAEVALVLAVVGIVLFVYTAFALAHLLREEQPWMGQIGALLATAGLLFIALMQGGFVAVGEAVELDMATATTMFDNMADNPVTIVALVGSVATAIGFVVLAVGLLQARTAPMWSAGLLAAGSVVQWFGIALASTATAVTGFGIVFLALAPLGYELIAEPDEAWEHPAHFEGFRPMVGAH